MRQSTRKNTKAALIEAAERLFAEKGLGIVSVKEITNAAGARNPSAVHYHFGNIEVLIKEVFNKRYQAIEQERLARLAKVDAVDKRARLVALLEASIAPFMEQCLEEEGRLYVRFCCQLLTDPRFDVVEVIQEANVSSILSLREELLESLQHIPKTVLRARLRQGLTISMFQTLEYAQLVEAGKAPPIDQAIREAAMCLGGYLGAEPYAPAS
ncbi:MAG: TetR/AcrR family transcriptional regulator [Pseudomonadota bacterium]